MDQTFHCSHCDMPVLHRPFSAMRVPAADIDHPLPKSSCAKPRQERAGYAVELQKNKLSQVVCYIDLIKVKFDHFSSEHKSSQN